MHKKKHHCLRRANARHDNAELEPFAHVYKGTSTIYAMTRILYSLHFSGIFNNRYCKSNAEFAGERILKIGSDLTASSTSLVSFGDTVCMLPRFAICLFLCN